MSVPLIEVQQTPDALATSVAGELLSRLADVQSSGREPQIALTGGTIARVVHREIARLSAEFEVDWSRVVVWWGDERFVAPDDPERNAVQAREDFLDAVGVDPAKVHEMPSATDGVSLEAGAAAYSDVMRAQGAGEFEIVMLGVGPDGHVASLFPGHAALDVDDRIAVAVSDAPKPPPDRISLTFAALNRARTVWFLVSGQGKAGAVARALGATTPDVHDVPAVGVSGTEETVWFLDHDAASAL